MSKWISRECALSGSSKSAFVEVGHTDFSQRAPVAFTVSLCGRFVLVVRERKVYVYELNHVCSDGRPRWSVPRRQREGLALGSLRPVSAIECPGRVISCSMDTSEGRNAVALLMEGRSALVCEISSETLGCASSSSSSSSGSLSSSEWNPEPPGPTIPGGSQCVCRRKPGIRGMDVENGSRSIYHGLCHADDPPRVVALCPQRNCVAFGCSSGIELHWVGGLTGRDFKRWFPLTSPSDHLYFLPPRRGVDTPKRLRLISSATTSNLLDALGNIVYGFNTTLFGSGSTSIVSFLGPASDVSWAQDSHNTAVSIAMGSSRAGRFRAVPLSDGYHMLFTDPCSGHLSLLGADAPIGSLARLLRKVRFRPPSRAASPLPALYSAGADLSHGVRVVAAFAAQPRVEVPREATWPSDGGQPPQMTLTEPHIIMHYTIPPDTFHHIARAGVGSDSTHNDASSEWVHWWREGDNLGVDTLSNPYDHNTVIYPLDVRGQEVATCNNLMGIGVDSSPDMVIWAFSGDGWAKTWALNTGDSMSYNRSLVQRDGSLRNLDSEGDVVMEEAGDDVTPPNTATDEGSRPRSTRRAEAASDRNRGTWTADRMSAMLSVDLVEEVSGIARVDVELR